MYANIVAAASFWSQLVEIDRKLQQEVIAQRCPRCGGPLHVADHPRKPRGVPDAIAEACGVRFNTCCGRCRRRCLPPSVRFLGQRVYVGVVVMLATMRALVCGATRRTLDRWRSWWTQQLPSSAWWRGHRAQHSAAIETGRLPQSLLELFESDRQRQSEAALVRTLRVLSTLGEGARATIGVTQRMLGAPNCRGLLRQGRAPTQPS